MAAYNESQTVDVVLRRIFSVDIPLREVIVIDNGSTDGTAEIVEQVAAEDPRVRLHRQRTNWGKTAAIGRALREASGAILLIKLLQDTHLETAIWGR